MSGTLHVIIGCPLCTQAILTSRLCGLDYALKFYISKEDFNKTYKHGIVDDSWSAPVLVDTEAGILNQNRAINKYFASVSNTDVGRKLTGKTLFEQSSVDQSLDKLLGLEKPFLVLHQNLDKSGTDAALKEVREILGHFESQLESNKYVMGENMSLVDLAFIAFMVQGRRIVLDKPVLAAYKRVDAYLTALMAQDFYTLTFGKVGPVFIPGPKAEAQQNSTANKKAKGKKENPQSAPAKPDAPKQETAKPMPATSENDEKKMQDLILGAVDDQGKIFSLEFSAKNSLDNEKLVGILKSLESKEYLLLEKNEDNIIVLMKEGTDALENGTVEYRVWSHIPNEGMSMKDAQSQLGDLYKFGFQNAARKNWLKLDKVTGNIVKVETSVADDDRELLVKITEGKYSEIDVKTLALLKKRKFAEGKKILGFYVTKGPEFSRTVVEKLADLTGEMIQKGTWKD
jgi:glutathione S-transferase